MGICSTRDADKQVLLCGLDQVGKTTLLYTEYGMHLKEFSTEPTLGFNFETVSILNQRVGVFDIGGQEAVRYLWPVFFRQIQFDGLLFMIDATDDKRFYEAKQEFHKLVNEEELRNVVFCVLYNYKDQEDVEEEIVDKADQMKEEKDAERTERLTKNIKMKKTQHSQPRDSLDGNPMAKKKAQPRDSLDGNPLAKKKGPRDSLDGNPMAKKKGPRDSLESSPMAKKKGQRDSLDWNTLGDMSPLKPQEKTVDIEKIKERDALKRSLDSQLGIDELHTFQVRRSFLFNIKDSKDEEAKKEMYEWFIDRLRNINE